LQDRIINTKADLIKKEKKAFLKLREMKETKQKRREKLNDLKQRLDKINKNIDELKSKF